MSGKVSAPCWVGGAVRPCIHGSAGCSAGPLLTRVPHASRPDDTQQEGREGEVVWEAGLKQDVVLRTPGMFCGAGGSCMIVVAPGVSRMLQRVLHLSLHPLQHGIVMQADGVWVLPPPQPRRVTPPVRVWRTAARGLR
jgi:hypothetical protein